MSLLRLTPAARADLDSIWNYTAERWNVDQAETYVRSLHHVMRLLAGNPSLGRSAEAIRSGYLKFPIASHIVFYRRNTNAIEVIRILHKSMDVERHL